jgi:hypothetical protein
MKPEVLNLIATLIQAVIALITAIAAGLSLYSIRILKKEAKSSLLFNCMEKFLDINRQRAAALQEKSVTKCEGYFREILDLQWLEFKLWRDKYIETSIFKTWLSGRKKSYEKEKYEFKTNVTSTASYKHTWHKLVTENYFPDSFVEFMEMVHRGEIDKALKKFRR